MRINKYSLDLKGYFCTKCQPAALTIEAALTCPAGVAATVAAHWIAAISVAAVTALTTLQPISAILTMIKKTSLLYLNGHNETLQVICCFKRFS